MTGVSVLAQAELARRLYVTPQSIGPQVETLVARGLLRRVMPEGRGRAIAVHLTDDGRRVLGRAAGQAAEVERRTTAHLSSEDRERLTRDLRGMLERLEGA